MGLQIDCFSDGHGGSVVEVRSLHPLLGPRHYNKLLQLLAGRGFTIERSHSFTWARSGKPCSEAVAEIR
ncbi:MAG: hypothetical protein ACP5GL_08580, partial [Infirmifilum sp.]